MSFLDSLARYPNIFTDTSGVRRFDLLEEGLARAGPEKLLFGSDGPWLHPGVELFKVRALGLAPAAEELILGGNFRRLISKVRADAVASRSTGAPGAAPQLEFRDPWPGASPV